MDYIEAQNILKNQALFEDQPEIISEAEKVIKAKETKTDITEQEAEAVLKNKALFEDQPELVARAEEYQRMHAPGEAWAKKYFPVKPGGGFDFNWRQYANTDKVDDIEKKRLASMWDLTDKVDLRDVAVDMRFKNKNEKWEDFIKSDRFPEFKNFLKDVAKYQQNKELDAIWNDDSSFFVDFGLPIAKEYARKNYEDIPTEDGLNLAGLNKMKAPLIADFATNAAMAGAGKVANKVGNTIAKDAIEYGAAPAIGAVSDALINDKPAVEIPANVFIGYGANKVTPNVLGAGFRWFNYGPNSSPKSVAKKAIDNAVNTYEKNKNILVRDKQGGIWDYANKKVYYPEGKADEYDLRVISNKNTEKFSVLPKDKMPTSKQVVESDVPLYNDRDLKEYIAGYIDRPEANTIKEKGIRFVKDLNPNGLKAKKTFNDLNPFNVKQNTNIKRFADKEIESMENQMKVLDKMEKEGKILPNPVSRANIEKRLADAKALKDIESRFETGKLNTNDILNHPNEVRSVLKYHGIKDKETIYNYFKRNEGGLTKSYFENIWGGSPQAQRQVERTLKAMVPQNLYDFNKDEEEKKKSLMEKIYGIN